MKRTSASASSLHLARKRARLRRDSAGAAIFIVAVTLGVLAVMGVYSLTSTAADIRSAGHMREAMHGQKASELAMMATGEAFAAVAADKLIARMRNTNATDPNSRSTNCKSSKAPTALDAFKDAEACVRLTPEQLRNIAAGVKNDYNVAAPFVPTPGLKGCGTPANCGLFWGGAQGSFGPVGPNITPEVVVEVTNPVFITPPPGMGLDGTFTYVQLTASVYTKIYGDPTRGADLVTVGRGRMTVGPTQVSR
jgi:hypothetical protein